MKLRKGKGRYGRGLGIAYIHCEDIKYASKTKFNIVHLSSNKRYM